MTGEPPMAAMTQLGKASVPLCRPMLTRMAGEQPRRPQFVGIAEFLGLAASQVDNPCLGLGGDRRLPAWPRSIVERRPWTIGQRPLDTALDGLMVRTHGPPHRKEQKSRDWIAKNAAGTGAPAPKVSEGSVILHLK